jgi:rare lipoprotein A
MAIRAAKRQGRAQKTLIRSAFTFARCFALVPIVALTFLSSNALAATNNPEAASPQRAIVPAARVPAPRVQPVVRPVATTTTTGRSPNAPAVARAPTAIAPVRQVTVPILGREGPAAAAAQANTRQIAITASEPELASMVRPSDVAAFQKIGAPYQVNGTWYVPAHEPDYDETGVASWYGNEFHGRPTANGEIFDMNVVSGAHPTLPIPSLVEVTNLTNGRSIVVRINDRGPFVGSRLIDMSARGAELLGFRQQGHANVRVRYVGPADAEPRVTPNNLTMATNVTAIAATKPLQAAAVQPVVASVLASTAPSVAQQVFVQVGAFSQIANAHRLRDQAASLGPVQLVEATAADGAPLYRVVLGPIADRATALAKVEEMNNSGFASARVMASLN